MKHLFIIALVTLCCATKAQVNLVPNPSFEDTVYCPCCTNQTDACLGWSAYRSTPEYLSTCPSSSGLGVPLNYGFGYQYPRTGNGMTGVATYRKPTSPNGPNYREHIGCQLLSPLVIGTKYYISLYINFANNPNIAIAANKMGCRFSMQTYAPLNPSPVTNYADVYSDSIYQNSVDWLKVSGSFIPTQNYQYLILGNFFDDNNTDTLNVSQFPDIAYYYVDDVCVSTDSNYCQTWTALNNENKQDVGLTINTFSENAILIKSEVLIKNVSVIDLSGRIELERKFVNYYSYQINVSNLTSSIYLLKVETLEDIFYKKVIINH
ncbi:MAG TPA: T9SS type A sorting domain-containing protein [Bacteroidia bacterium]|nr:T9SS type A sorting domain-containing protein [Bacteroidia bacterium]HNU32484.1 T9SS type A sorting domain-containing protein [Bacteroidia bacterium]